jgi:hypothetical protein
VSDLIFGDLEKVLPRASKLNAVFVEYRPFARKEERRYRAVVQWAGPKYGFLDAYAPDAVLAIYRLEVRLRAARDTWPQGPWK